MFTEISHEFVSKCGLLCDVTFEKIPDEGHVDRNVEIIYIFVINCLLTFYLIKYIYGVAMAY